MSYAFVSVTWSTLWVPLWAWFTIKNLFPSGLNLIEAGPCTPVERSSLNLIPAVVTKDNDVSDKSYGVERLYSNNLPPIPLSEIVSLYSKNSLVPSLLISTPSTKLFFLPVLDSALSPPKLPFWKTSESRSLVAEERVQEDIS